MKMKIKQVIKNVIKIAVVLSTSFFIITTSFSRGWEQDAIGEWHYVEDDGTYIKNKIVPSGASKFYLNNDGNIEKNFFLQDYRGHSYYFISNGMMVTNFSVYIKTTTKSNKEIYKNQRIYFDEKGRASKIEEEYLSEPIEQYYDTKNKIKENKAKYLYLKNGDTFNFGHYNMVYNDGFSRDEELNWKVINRNIDSIIAYCTIPLNDNNTLKKISCEAENIEEWLNKDFLDIAFNEYEKELLTEKVLNNKPLFLLNTEDYNEYVEESMRKQKLIGICLSIKD